jgi:hypothetical protein
MVASFLVFVSGKKIYFYASNFSRLSFYLLWNCLVFSVSIIGVILFLTRKHILIDGNYLLVRDTVIKKQISIQLSEIQEIVYGKQDWGVWTKGRKVLTIKKLNGDNLHFFSAAWISKNKLIELFEKLKKLGVNVSFK